MLCGQVGMVLLPEQVRESRIVDMVNTLNRARSQVTSAAERSALLDSITAEAGRVRSGREAETTASVLGKVAPVAQPLWRGVALICECITARSTCSSRAACIESLSHGGSCYITSQIQVRGLVRLFVTSGAP